MKPRTVFPFILVCCLAAATQARGDVILDGFNDGALGPEWEIIEQSANST